MKSKASTTRMKPLLANTADLARSISMPPDQHNLNQVNNNVKHERKLTLNTDLRDTEINENTKDSANFSDGSEYQITPTEMLDPIFADNRRASAGSLLTTEMGFNEPDLNESSDRFYVIKKESQRRHTLVRVLQKDQIIDSWHMQVANSQQNSSITKVRTISLIHTF